MTSWLVLLWCCSSSEHTVSLFAFSLDLLISFSVKTLIFRSIFCIDLDAAGRFLLMTAVLF